MARRCTKEGCEHHTTYQFGEPTDMIDHCTCDHYRGNICCQHRTRELARILLKGSTVDFDLDEGYIRYMIRHGRKCDIDAAFWALGKKITDIESDYIA